MNLIRWLRYISSCRAFGNSRTGRRGCLSDLWQEYDVDLFRIGSRSNPHSLLCASPSFFRKRKIKMKTVSLLLISVSGGSSLSDTQKILVSSNGKRTTLPDSLSIALLIDQNTFVLFEDSERIYGYQHSNSDSENVLYEYPPFIPFTVALA